MKAIEKLEKQTNSGRHICVGLDTDLKKIPPFLLNRDDPAFEFNRVIIDNTVNDAAAYKLNFAFYEAEGMTGLQSLKKTIEYIKENHDDVLVIADAKRGDIGNTSKKYASALFDHFKADASTLHPYMGSDSIEPFLEYEDNLNFILVLTSNPGSKDFEKLELKDGRKVYQAVLEKIHQYNSRKNCGIVFGATQPDELAENLDSVGDLPVLLPGIGAQGGDLESVLRLFNEQQKSDFIINSSRGIIYKDSSEKFGEAAAEELNRLNKIIEKFH